MAHRKKCAYCGHKVEMRNGELIHSSPHPDHICKCKTPVAWDKKFETENKKFNRVQAGISTYSGYVSRGNDLESS